MQDQFVLEMLAKSDGEVEIDGQLGIVMAGYATKFRIPDKEADRIVDTALYDLPDTWGQHPVIKWFHGLDSVIGFRDIGRAIEHKVDKVGLFVKVFIPKSIADKWNEPAARLKFKGIYEDIRRGAIRGFSISGLFLKSAGGETVKMSMNELSIVRRPCHPEALGTVLRGELARKALSDDGEDDLMDQEDLGIIPRDSWSGVMYTARKYHDSALHDHLLSQDPHFQGQHDPEDCAICQDRRATWYGVKSAEDDKGYGGFLVTDARGDKYLPTEKEGKVSRRLLGAAHAALTEGFRGKKYAGPGKLEALAKLRKLYDQQGMEWPAEVKGKSDPDDMWNSFAERYKNQIETVCLEAKMGAKHSAETRALIQDTVDKLKQHFLANR